MTVYWNSSCQLECLYIVFDIRYVIYPPSLQAVWVWTVSLPVTVVNSSNRNPSLQAEDIIGWIIWLVGFLVEATADQQKLTFKNSPENRGKWCNVGLWQYPRHPNYFGEVSAAISFRCTYNQSWC